MQCAVDLIKVTNQEQKIRAVMSMFGDTDSDDEVESTVFSSLLQDLWIYLNQNKLKLPGAPDGDPKASSFTKKTAIVASKQYVYNTCLRDFVSNRGSVAPKLVFIDLEAPGELTDEVFDFLILLSDQVIAGAGSSQDGSGLLNSEQLRTDSDNGSKLVDAAVANEFDMLAPGGELILLKADIPSEPCNANAKIEAAGFELRCRNTVTTTSRGVELVRLCFGKKMLVEANTDSAEYWSKDAHYPGREQECANIKELCVTTCVEERVERQFSVATHQQAVEILKRHGVVIFPGLFEQRLVLDYAKAALRDMEKAVSQLKRAKGGIDLFRPGKGPKIENYQELGMREPLRCDLRNGTAMKKQAKASDRIRHHPGIKRVLLEVMHSPPAYATPFPVHTPDRKEENRAREIANKNAGGNWGRWNFEGPGPEGPPPPLRVGQVGCVMSLPGCEDQTIHADTPHIYTHAQLPGHYYNLFLVGVERGSPATRMECGQTAFILGSHNLETCESIMAGTGGQSELVRRLVRPHLSAGDALIFDCRILHLGLANRSRPLIDNPLQAGMALGGAEIEKQEAMEQEEVRFHPDCSLHLHHSRNTHAHAHAHAGDDGDGDGDGEESGKGSSLARPLLYINYTREFFEDPKNWNHKESLFGSDEGG